GAFPELIAATGGGALVAPGDPTALAAQLEDFLVNSAVRVQFGAQGRAVVHARYHPQALATQTLQLFQAARREKSL
ncbi:MAG: putative hexosyltransferase, partial [Planctomycetaceae bacterium]|nr:putative hexosyltransferase [Planctomycetaceae bacterium]